MAGATKSAAFMANTAKMGASIRAASISMPWKKSVQQTALKPPRKTYSRMMMVATIMAVLFSTPRTVLNRVPQAEMLEAEYTQ